MHDTHPYKIGQLVKEFDLTLRTLRFYQDRGLLSPKRVGTKRLYSEADRARLAQIVKLSRIGLTLVEIAQLIDLPSDAPEWPEILATREAELEGELRRTRNALREVRTMRESL